MLVFSKAVLSDGQDLDHLRSFQPDLLSPLSLDHRCTVNYPGRDG